MLGSRYYPLLDSSRSARLGREVPTRLQFVSISISKKVGFLQHFLAVSATRRHGANIVNRLLLNICQQRRTLKRNPTRTRQLDKLIGHPREAAFQ